jgi:hypothetical protein
MSKYTATWSLSLRRKSSNIRKLARKHTSEYVGVIPVIIRIIIIRSSALILEAKNSCTLDIGGVVQFAKKKCNGNSSKLSPDNYTTLHMLEKVTETQETKRELKKKQKKQNKKTNHTSRNNLVVLALFVYLYLNCFCSTCDLEWM